MNKDELLNKFYNIKTPQDVAELLGIKYDLLIYQLYKKKLSPQYKTFHIVKKTGGSRIITAPVSGLKLIQKKLNSVLQLVYPIKPSVHGYVLNKSIVTNSQSHIRKNYILNLDIKDFFPSINFGRVRGMFMSYPYKIPDKAATILAQICCYENQIPQGAPTSPIISNMICAKLDSQLQRLAKKNFCTYTRYADDITFSTTRKTLPDNIAKYISTKDGLSLEIGSDIENIININGFSINKGKTRLHKPYVRQVVTGLTVNLAPNVQRKYVRQIRAILHAWEKYGLTNANLEYCKKYNTKQRNPSREVPDLKNIIYGKLNFLKMVKGSKDPVYIKLANKYSRLAGIPFAKYYDDFLEEISDSVWILECEKTNRQGTAFMLQDVGLVTCAHVLGDSTIAFLPDRFTEKHKVSIKTINYDIDLAILNVDTQDCHFLQKSERTLKIRDTVTIAGFPNYKYGQTIYISDSKVACFYNKSTIRRIQINTPIIAGNSGGPILDQDNKVIGIAVTGADRMETASGTEDHGVIPISALDHLLSK